MVQILRHRLLPRFCFCLLFPAFALAQPSLSTPVTSYNNVQMYDTQSQEPALTPARYGPIIITAASASGGSVTYTASRSLGGAIVGHTICITVGRAGPGCTSTTTIITPGNNIPSNLLGTCVLTATKTTPPPVTYTCSSAVTASWTLAPPATEQNPSTVVYNNQLWQVFAQASAAIGPGLAIPGKLYIRTSSTSPSVYPPVWNTPYNLPVTVIPNCPSGNPPTVDVRIPLIGLMPNNDMAVFFLAYCYAVSPVYYGTTWFYHHDHTQPYNAGWTGPTQFTQKPSTWTNVNWGCMQDAGEMNYDPVDGMPVFTIGGVDGVTGSTCTNSYPWLIKTTDNGLSWSLVKSVFNGVSPGTFEFTLVNPSGQNWIGFLRQLGNSVSGVFSSPYFTISTDNMNTWTPWAPSNIPYSTACMDVFGVAATSNYIVSPVTLCGHPAKGRCVLFYADRLGCSSFAATDEVGVEYDPAQVLSNGATYLATLVPTTFHMGIIASGLDGYQFVVFPTANTFHMWWHGVNSSAANDLNIFETFGSFPLPPPPHSSTIMGGTQKIGLIEIPAAAAAASGRP